MRSVESDEEHNSAAKAEHNSFDASKLLRDAPAPNVDVPRERLAVLAAGGRARKFLGREYSAAQIDSMSPDEVERLYGRYQARLGSQIAESLGDSIIGLYCHVASRYLPIDDKEGLARDLKGDAFLGAAISGVCCELYYRFGSYLAPVSAALTTAKHITIRPRPVEYNNSFDESKLLDGDPPRLPEDTSSCGTADSGIDTPDTQ
jgi:hypothetical protein